MTNSDPSFGSAFGVMVEWIKAIKADTRDIPRLTRWWTTNPPQPTTAARLAMAKTSR
jgi:hypothetical protein